MVLSVNAIWKRSRRVARSGVGWYDVWSWTTFLRTQGYNMLICRPLGPALSLQAGRTTAAPQENDKILFVHKVSETLRSIWPELKTRSLDQEEQLCLTQGHDPPPELQSFLFNGSTCLERFSVRLSKLRLGQVTDCRGHSDYSIYFKSEDFQRGWHEVSPEIITRVENFYIQSYNTLISVVYFC